MDVQTLLNDRAAKDAMARSENSPLPPESREKFTGLIYYEPDSDFIFEAELRPVADDDEAITIEKTLGAPIEAKRFGHFPFVVDGEEAELTMFQFGEGELGIAFKDATSSKETYGGGRMVNVQQVNETRYRIDFNRASNPLCAYLPNYSCPIPPAENHLKVAIRAGEKKPEGDWVLV